MKSKSYLILGATSGIGLALTEILLTNEAIVYSASRSETHIKKEVFHQQINVSGDFELQLPDTLDGLVYCPGSINLKPFNRLTTKEFYEDWQLNCLGAAKAIQQALPKLKQSLNPSVVLFSSVVTKTGMPYHSSIAMAKGALEGLSRALAAEFAGKIRFNCIAPSLTISPLSDKFLNTEEKLQAAAKRHPLNRISTALEIAQIAHFLLSDKAACLSGQVINADNGMSSIKLV